MNDECCAMNLSKIVFYFKRSISIFNCCINYAFWVCKFSICLFFICNSSLKVITNYLSSAFRLATDKKSCLIFYWKFLSMKIKYKIILLWIICIVSTIVFLFILEFKKTNLRIIIGITVVTIIAICRYFINKLNQQSEKI